MILVSCIQILWSKTLDICCRLFRKLWDGKIFGVHFHRHGGSYSLSLSVVHSRYSSPLASSFFKAMSTNLICLASCLARCPKWRVSKNHIVRASTSGSWTLNWFSFNLKKAGVGQPKYCNNTYVHVVLTNFCSIFSIFKNGFNIFVCQSYCGVRFVSFTLLPGFPAFGFQDFSRYLEFFVLEDRLLSRCCHPRIAG